MQDALLAMQTASGMRAVFAPKSGGMDHLAAYLKRQPLSQVPVYSSVAGILGSGGQANYAAANSALDAWAQHSQHQASLNCTPILTPK